MVTALLQLHHDVEETGRASFRAFAECLVVSCQNPPMENEMYFIIHNHDSSMQEKNAVLAKAI